MTTRFEFHVGRGWPTSENALVKFVNRNKNDANGYYKALGLKPDATRDEIKAAYRKLAKQLHPDLGGDEEMFRFIADIASTLLNEETKRIYDSVKNGSIYLGLLEMEELARSGVSVNDKKPSISKSEWPFSSHWSCLTNYGFWPEKDVDEWVDFCREVSPAVGYRGKIRVGVIEGGIHWPCFPAKPWGILRVDDQTFVVFQKGAEPNRLHALCAMIDWQRHLLKQIEQGRDAAQDRERKKWLELAQRDSQESSSETKRSRPVGSDSDFESTPLSSAGMAASHPQRTP